MSALLLKPFPPELLRRWVVRDVSAGVVGVVVGVAHFLEVVAGPVAVVNAKTNRSTKSAALYTVMFVVEAAAAVSPLPRKRLDNPTKCAVIYRDIFLSSPRRLSPFPFLEVVEGSVAVVNTKKTDRHSDNVSHDVR